MELILKYKNSLGIVEMSGNSAKDIRVTALQGLGVAEMEYTAAVFSGYDGQETLASRALPRSVTIGVEICGRDILDIARETLRVLSNPGWLYIENGGSVRRIYCNQTKISDADRVLGGRIATFVVQLVCDSPFFEDGADTTVPLYLREKLLQTSFTLPSMFGRIIQGTTIKVLSAISVEPVITLHYPSALEEIESVIITNETTGAVIWLDYAPKDDDTVIIDIKNRKVSSSISGNIINKLSADTFLGDFVLVQGYNVLSVELGDVTSDFTIECKYNNLYNEAVIV